MSCSRWIRRVALCALTITGLPACDDGDGQTPPGAAGGAGGTAATGGAAGAGGMAGAGAGGMAGAGAGGMAGAGAGGMAGAGAGGMAGAGAGAGAGGMAGAGAGGMAGSPFEGTALAAPPAARACEAVISAPAGATIDVVFADGLRGKALTRAPRTAISFIATADAPVPLGAVALRVAGDVAGVSLTTTRCFDAAGEVLPTGMELIP